MKERLRGMGIFDNSVSAETALQELDNSSYSPERIFVITRNIDRETELVGSELCESLRDRFDEKISSLARQDHNILSGEIVISLTKVLTYLDVPTDKARLYSDLVAQDKYLIIIEGNRDDVLGAKTILKRCAIQDWLVCEIVSEHPEIIVIDRREVA